MTSEFHGHNVLVAEKSPQFPHNGLICWLNEILIVFVKDHISDLHGASERPLVKHHTQRKIRVTSGVLDNTYSYVSSQVRVQIPDFQYVDSKVKVVVRRRIESSKRN